MEKKKIIILFYLMLALIIIQISTVSAATSTVVFNPSDDTMINQADSPNSAFGDSLYMVVRNAKESGSNSIYEVDSLIKFDVLSIPSTSTILSASLKIYFYNWSESNAAGRSLNLYRITSSWNEETVRWNTHPSYASTPSSSSTVPESKGQWMTWNVKNDVQYFVNERACYGWKITDENNQEKVNIPTVYFRTKEYGNYIPYLEVTYRVPETNTKLISGFSIIPLNPTTEDTIQFTDHSYDSNGTITAWFWNFGDGNSSTSRNSTHKYTQSGQYTVTLQVTDNDGATNSMTVSISISKSKSTPGFEFIIAVCAIAFVLFLKLKGKKRI